MDLQAPAQHPVSARGPTLSLAERVALYSHQATAAHNAGVLRNVAKPTAEEMASFLQQMKNDGASLYDDSAMLRILLTDSEYDSVCRDFLSLGDAIAWHETQAPRRASASTTLEMLLQCNHLFAAEEIQEARIMSMSPGLVPSNSVDPQENQLLTQSTPDPTEIISQRNGQQDEELTHLDSTQDRATDDEPVGEAQSPSQSEDARISDSETILPELSEDNQAFKSEETMDYASNGLIGRVNDPVASQMLCDCDSDCVETPELPSPEEGHAHDPAILTNDSQVPPDSQHDSCDDYIDGRNGEADRNDLFGAVHDVLQAMIKLVDENNVSDTTTQTSEHEHAGIDAPPVEVDECVSGDRTARQLQAERCESEPEGVEEPERTHSLESQLREAEDDVAESDSPTLVDNALINALINDGTVEEVIRIISDEGENDREDKAIGEDASVLEKIASTVAEELEDRVADKREPDSESSGGINHSASCSPSTAEFQAGVAVEAEDKENSQYLLGADLAFYEGIRTYDSIISDGDAESRVVSVRVEAQPVAVAVECAPVPLQHTNYGKYCVNEAVHVRYRGSTRYFRAEIAAVFEHGRYDIRYSDGEYESDVATERIQQLSEARARISQNEPFELTEHSPLAAESPPVSNANEAIEHLQSTEGSGETHALVSSSEPTSRKSVRETSKAREAESVLIRSESDDPNRPDAPLFVGQRIRVQTLRTTLLGWIVGISEGDGSTDDDDHLYDVLCDCAHDGSPIETFKEKQVRRNRLERVDQRDHPVPKLALDKLMSTPRRSEHQHAGEFSERTPADQIDIRVQHEEMAVETPVVPFRDSASATCSTKAEATHEWRSNRQTRRSDEPSAKESACALAHVPYSEHDSSSEIDGVEVDRIVEATARLSVVTPRSVEASTSTRPKLPAEKPQPARSRTVRVQSSRKHAHLTRAEHATDDLDKVSFPQSVETAKSITRGITERPRTGSIVVTARVDRAKTPRGLAAAVAPAAISWQELEEWKNVDLILNRKRHVMSHGQVGGSDVPWGEEFAAIQSLKRFASQHPDVLREHVESKLRAVIQSDEDGHSARPLTTKATSAARDALYLTKDLAFLLRHRLAPFLDSILPVVLPAVFHSQKRFLCDTAYEVLEALVAHCSGRRLAVAFLKQALRFPREDLRLINLTCLYVEKCLATLSLSAVEELLTRSTGAVLEAIAELLTCKSAACQSSLQKCLLLMEQAVGEGTIEYLLVDHLTGNSLALVRKHLVLAESAARGGPKSPSVSPKKKLAPPQSSGSTSAKQAAALAAAASPNGSVSILQRMLQQRQNRVVPSSQ